MPSFLNPMAAAIAAGVVIPSLLLLYFLKLRRREFDVPSTLLWKKAIQDLQVNAPFQKLRKNLLLFLQMLLLVLLLLALSRPIVNYSPGAGRLNVIAIDRSASMGARDIEGDKSRLDEAKRHARELVDSMDKNAQAMVIAFDDTAEIVRAFTSDRALLKQAIDSINPTDRRSALKTAFQLAEAKAMAFTTDQQQTAAGEVRPELWVYSDGRVLDAGELSLRFAELKYTKIGTDKAPNAAVVALNAKRNYERPTEVQVFARLANFGPEPITIQAQVSVDGNVVARGVKRVTLAPERWSREEREKAEKEKGVVSQEGVEFNLELTTGATVKVELKENGGDCLVADDVAQIVVPKPRSLKAVLVTAQGNWWLERFLESAPLKDPEVIAPAKYAELMKDPAAVAATYDVILFDRVTPEALPPSGNFMFFGAVPPQSRITAAVDAAGVQQLIKEQTVLDWERNHPMLVGLNLQFWVADALKLNVPIEAQVLVDGRQSPLVVFHRQGRHTYMVFSFDVQESGWPRLPSFPVFMTNALQYLALGSDMDLRASYPPGSTPRIPRHSLVQTGVDLKQLKLEDPSGNKVTLTVPPTGDFALPALEKVGVYTLDPPVPQYEKIAVNLLDDNESNLLPVEQPPGGSGKTIAATKGKSRFEIWWWIVAFAAIPLCLIEWWVYTRRVHL